MDAAMDAAAWQQTEISMDQTPSTPTTAVERAGPGTIARVGLLGAAAAALVAVGILAFGAGASPAGTLAADEATGTTDVEAYAFDFGGPGAGGRGFGHRGITITAISGSSISLATADGWTRTITVDSGTTYTESGDDIALSDLAVGDDIRFQQTLEDDGTYSIDAIAVIQPHAGGEVTAVSGSTITVERRDGTTSTITVTASTTYEVNGVEAALADVEVGMVLVAVGTKDADGNLTATEVRAADPGSFVGPGGHGGRHHGPGGFFGPNDGSDDTDDTTDDSESTSAG